MYSGAPPYSHPADTATLLIGPLYSGLNKSSASHFLYGHPINKARFLRPIGDQINPVPFYLFYWTSTLYQNTKFAYHTQPKWKETLTLKKAYFSLPDNLYNKSLINSLEEFTTKITLFQDSRRRKRGPVIGRPSWMKFNFVPEYKHMHFSWNVKDISISGLLGALCSSVKWAAKSSVTWLGSPPGKAAHTGHTLEKCNKLTQ